MVKKTNEIYWKNDPNDCFLKAWSTVKKNFLEKDGNIVRLWQALPNLVGQFTYESPTEKSLLDVSTSELILFYGMKLRTDFLKYSTQKDSPFKSPHALKFYLLFENDFANLISMTFMQALYKYLQSHKQGFYTFKINIMLKQLPDRFKSREVSQDRYFTFTKTNINSLDIFAFLYGYNNNITVITRWLKSPQPRTKMPSFLTNLQVCYQILLYLDFPELQQGFIDFIEDNFKILTIPRSYISTTPLGQMAKLFIKVSKILLNGLK